MVGPKEPRKAVFLGCDLHLLRCVCQKSSFDEAYMSNNQHCATLEAHRHGWLP